MAQAIQIAHKNEVEDYQKFYPNTAMNQIDGNIQVLAKIEIKTNNAWGTVAVSDGESISLNYDGNGFIYLPYGTYTFSMTKNSDTVTKTLIVDSIKKYVLKIYDVSKTLNDNDWATISNVSSMGLASNYWSVGDCKAVTLNGDVVVPTFVIALSLSSYSTCVYILDFDHDMSSANGTKDGITFGTFKTAVSNGVDVALLSSQYGSDGNYFGMNTTSTNSGGWESSYMRYTVLGSTDTKNGDATATTATSPREGTLMSCFPSDLRAVMRPMYIYTDNTGGTSDTASYVTGTLDYLPLLAEFEVFGARTIANSAEQNYQTQYQYYKDGNSKVKHRHARTSLTVPWWERSIATTYASSFCMVTSGGTSGSQAAKYSYSLAPMFKI